MNIDNWNIWNRLAFKTFSYRKNFDLIIENENIITESVGTISVLNILRRKVPTLIGEYSISVWNINLANLTKINVIKLIKSHNLEDTYDELIELINGNNFDVMKYNKIVFIHSLVIHPEFRKRGITEEFVELIYRDFYSSETCIIMLCKPIQNNKINADYYFNEKIMQIRTELNISNVPAMKYYGLNKLLNNNDIEFNEYKLFAIAKKCGFTRIGDSHLFQFKPDTIIKRIKEKNVIQAKLKKESI